MGILDKRINPKSEKYIQNQVINNKSLQKYIIDSLNIKYEDSIKFSKGLTEYCQISKFQKEMKF